MRLENISISNFKNYQKLALDFKNDINCFVGENGSGKTNLLDAIHYLSLTKSAFNVVDNQNIKHGELFFSLRGDFKLNDTISQASCSLKQRQKKIFKLDQKPYEKLSEHIGKFPVVLINPNDYEIIRDGSEVRRRFFDSIISQIDQVYLKELIQYNHVLKQRNSLLKQFQEENSIDKDLLEPFDLQIIKLGQSIFSYRNKFIKGFVPVFQKHYQSLSAQKETTKVNYQSHFQKADFKADFFKSLTKDLATVRTNIGSHKDDFLFEIGEYPLKKFGSQGQQKSFIIALKLAQFEMISKEKGYRPILLLDDIFDKLDDHRIMRLMQMLMNDAFGQIFVTDARPERTKIIFDRFKTRMTIFHIEGGKLIREEQKDD